MRFSEAVKKGLFQEKIFIGQFFEGAKEEDLFIVVREPTALEVLQLSKNETRIEGYKKLLPEIIIEHNFTEDDDKTFIDDERLVNDLLYKSGALFLFMISKLSVIHPLTVRSKGK